MYLHSAGGETEWTTFHERLAERFTVYLPAHPGFAESEGLKQIDDIHDLAWHYVDLLDTLELQKVPIVGFSLGGWLAVELAILRPDRVEKLFIVNAAGLHVDGAPMGELFVNDLDQLRELVFYDPQSPAVQLAMPISLDDDRIPHWIRARKATERICKDPYLHNPRLPAQLRRVECPTMVLWGREDRLIPLAHGEFFAQHIPALPSRFSTNVATCCRSKNLTNSLPKSATSSNVTETRIVNDVSMNRRASRRSAMANGPRVRIAYSCGPDSTALCAGSVVLNQAKRLVRRDALSATQARQLNHESTANDIRSYTFDQSAAGLHGPARGQQIIDQQYVTSRLDAVDVNFQRVGAIFQFVMEGVRIEGQFSRFTNRYEPGIQLQSERRGKNKPSGLGGGDQMNFPIAVVVRQALHCRPQGSRGGEHRGDVAK